MIGKLFYKLRASVNHGRSPIKFAAVLPEIKYGLTSLLYLYVFIVILCI